MKPIFPAVVSLPIALMTSLAFSTAVNSAPSRHKTITCPFLKEGRLTFAKATSFSFRDGNLLLVAMDEGESSRLRVVVSAQLNKKNGSYDGQIFVDMGGTQLMLHNGPVRCTVAAG